MRLSLTKNLVALLALAGATGLSIHRWVLPRLVEGQTFTDGTQRYSGLQDEVRFALWEEPERAGGEVNGPERESRPALSPDGRWMVFAVGEDGLNADLWIAEMVEGEPRAAEPVAELNGPADELAPAFARGRLYFASNRAGGAGGYDLYVAPFDGERFGAPRPIGGVNTAADETDPAPVGGALSLALAFASDRTENGHADFDLYLALPGPEGDLVVEPLTALNTPFDERDPAFAADGRALFFASDREGPAGRFDLFRSVRDGEEWPAARPLERLNGAGSQRGPAPSPDGFALWFQRSEEAPQGAAAAGATGASDLWRARSIELFRLPYERAGLWELLTIVALVLLALLALLSQRWSGLDVIYKCLLISLLLHLLLLWYFREVYPDDGMYQLGPGDDATFHVRLLSSGDPRAGQRELGGALELARAEAVAPAPERLASTTERELDTERERAPDAQPLERRADALAAAPEPMEAATERSQSPAPARSPELEADAVEFERFSAQAPELALDADALQGTRAVEAERADTAVRAPSRVTTSAARAPSLESAPSSSAPLARRADPTPDAGPTVEPSAPLEPVRAADTASSPELVRPSDGAALREALAAARPAAAPEAALPAPSAFAETRASQDAAAIAPREFERPRRAASDEALAPRPLEALARRSARAEPAAPAFTPSAPTPMRPLEALSEGPEIARPTDALEARPLVAAAAPRAPALPEPESFQPRRDVLADVDRPAPRQFERPRRDAAPSIAPAPELALRARPTDEVLPEAPRPLDRTPYRSRFGRDKEVALELLGGSEETEQAVAAGLRFLASRQKRDGYWGDPSDYHEKYKHVTIGKTGLALLAFLGAGHTPGSGTEHADVARRAVDFLIAVQDERTGQFGDTSSYSHGIATYALAECYALTNEARLRRPIERGVERILRNQVRRGDPRLIGGWTYYYIDGSRQDGWPRASITAWQVMALESARLGGIEVPEEALERARVFLEGSWDERRGAYRYSHDPQRLASRYETLPGSTPAALFVLSLMGEDTTAERFARAREFVLDRRPTEYATPRRADDFVFRAAGNLYFWYYGSLALVRTGGETWERWNAALQETLLPAQAEDGSWAPIGQYARAYAGDTDRDPIYATAMCVLTLEVYYRYFTPLLEKR